MRTTNSARMICFIICLSLFSFLCVPGLKAAATLPKFGVSIPTDADAAAFAKIVSGAGIKDPYVMLPPISSHLSQVVNPNTYASQEGIIGLMPAEAHLYQHLRISFGDYAQKGKELEALITLQTTDIINRLDLNNPRIEGLLVEVSGRVSSAELAQFALADIVVKSKSRKSNLRTVLSFPQDFIETNGDIVRKLASYYDALNPEFTPNWKSDISWISKQALN